MQSLPAKFEHDHDHDFLNFSHKVRPGHPGLTVYIGQWEMGMGHAHRKHLRLTQLKKELIRNGPCKKKDLVHLLGVDQSSLHRYLIEIEAEKVAHGMWVYVPVEDEIDLARMIIARYG